MALHNTLGKKGEALALAYFKERDYDIRETNWKYRKLEIDIIAMKENKLHIIEVKYRTSSQFGWPEEKVTKKKMRNLFAAADEYLSRFPDIKFVQFDILSINEPQEGMAVYFLISDIYP